MKMGDEFSDVITGKNHDGSLAKHIQYVNILQLLGLCDKIQCNINE